MSLTSPKFWYNASSFLSYILDPFSWVYRMGTAFNQFFSRPYRASVSVISIGNFVMGGSGKTPVCIALAQKLQSMGHKPHIISRGYGGSLGGPVCVNLEEHNYKQVGDEPLLLATYAPTWISKNRKAAALMAIQAGADILLLDDAHQNHDLIKDLSFVVVNGAQGFGNGHIFPAGPLRQSVKSGLKNTSAIIFISENNDPLPQALSSMSCPLIHASIELIDPKPCEVVAFAGIGYPDKFRQTLLTSGYEVKAFIPFPDHHPYTEENIRQLRTRARHEQASLITTEKDAMRIPVDWRKGILVLPMYISLENEASLKAILEI